MLVFGNGQIMGVAGANPLTFSRQFRNILLNQGPYCAQRIPTLPPTPLPTHVNLPTRQHTGVDLCAAIFLKAAPGLGCAPIPRGRMLTNVNILAPLGGENI